MQWYVGDKGRYGGFIHLCKIQNVSVCMPAKQNKTVTGSRGRG